MNATFRDRAVVFGETLVLADLHVGKARAANVELPLGERDDLVERLAALLAEFDPTEVVVAGDLLHSFDRVPSGAQETVTALSRTVREGGGRLVVVRGNHDTMLETLWSGPVHGEYELEVPGIGGSGDGGGEDGSEGDQGDESGTVVVCHGHVAPEADADLYVIGHDHPTITVEGRKWHCYLYGPRVYRGADVLVVPAFSRLIEGVSINRRTGTASLTSPLITDLDRFRPIVRDEDAAETREFPPLAEFRDLL